MFSNKPDKKKKVDQRFALKRKSAAIQNLTTGCRYFFFKISNMTGWTSGARRKLAASSCLFLPLHDYQNVYDAGFTRMPSPNKSISVLTA